MKIMLQSNAKNTNEPIVLLSLLNVLVLFSFGYVEYARI